MDRFKIDDDAVEKDESHCLCRMTLEEWARKDKQSLEAEWPDLFRFSGERRWEDLVRPPNADDAKPSSVAQAAHAIHGERHRCAAQPFCLGAVVPMGHIQLVHNNGIVEVLTHGRYAMKLFGRGIYPPASWGTMYNIADQDTVTDATFTLARVARGSLGLAYENGRPVLLGEGLHVYNSALFRFGGVTSVNKPHIQHMSFHLIRVARGFFAQVRVGTAMKLLPEGIHFVDDPIFSYDGQVPVSGNYIQHGTIHIVRVPTGHLGRVLESNSPRLLSEGVYVYDSGTFAWKGNSAKMEQSIIFNTISRFRILKGKVAVAYLNNQPVFIEDEGTYQVDSATFRLIGLVPIEEKEITLGALKIITVSSGEVGISYKDGQLFVLPAGRHYIDHVAHIFDSFLSTQRCSIRLRPRGTDEKMFECQTGDFVKIGVYSGVVYRIADPAAVITTIGLDNVEDLVIETSIACMTNIVRSNALKDIKKSGLEIADKEGIQEKSSAPLQSDSALCFDRAADQFLAKVHEVLRPYGIEVSNIRIERFEILSEVAKQQQETEKLADILAKQVLKTTDTQNQLLNLEGRTLIATQTQQRDTDVQRIKAEAEALVRQIELDSEQKQAEARARALQVKADGEAAAFVIKAEGEAEAARILARATMAEQDAQAQGVKLMADVIVKQAEAEAQAVSIRAEAEAARAAGLSAIKLGEQLALLGVYGEVIKDGNEGVENVIYVDPASSQNGNPFGLLALKSLQQDIRDNDTIAFADRWLADSADRALDVDSGCLMSTPEDQE